MANYPQLDNARGVWNLREVYDAVMGGYWPSAKNRLFFMGGLTGASPYSASSIITTFNPTSGGTAELFGDLITAQNKGNAGAGNFVRGLSMGGADWPSQNEFDDVSYITLATAGNSANFGDLTNASQAQGGGSNSTRAIRNGGTPGPSYYNTIDYVTIMSTGNFTDFGDQTISTDGHHAVTSPTRYVMAGSRAPVSNTIDFIEIATTGNAVDFGDLTQARTYPQAASNSTRGIFMGGLTPSYSSVIEFVTMASQGNGIDFGDLDTTVEDFASIGNIGIANKGFTTGGGASGYTRTGVQGVSIINGGTATDFGNLAYGQRYGAVCSDGHGGLNDGYQGTRPLPFNEAGGDRGIFVFDDVTNGANAMNFINISTTGDANDFGNNNANLTQNSSFGGAASKTRLLIAGGLSPSSPNPQINGISYITISTAGNTSNFGDLSASKNAAGGLANNTKALFGGGQTPSNSNVIEYVTMTTFGNGTDFGDLTTARYGVCGSSSNVRGVFLGGRTPTVLNTIDFITIATAGDATDFGDLTNIKRASASVNSTTRVVSGGGVTPSYINIMDYITTASTGNATDFGDLTQARGRLGGVSNTTRGVFGGGDDGSSYYNIMDFITIASTGNASDFGDLTSGARTGSSGSNGHGGLVSG